MRRAGRFGLFLACLLVFALFSSTAAARGRCGNHPWCNTHLSADARANLLVNALTEDEKISLLGGDDFNGGISGGAHQHTGTSDGISRLGIPTTYYSDGPLGPRQGNSSALPAPMGLAATFQPNLAASAGSVVANEAKFKGNDVVFAPTVNIMRNPLGGRSFEAYGEDPFVDTQMAVRWIEGAQSQGVIADVKHFAANNQEGADPTGTSGSPGSPLGAGPFGSRYITNAIIDERTLREIYLPHFEAAVTRAHVGTVMCAYNQVNGRYACENHHLLQEILEREWGFKGYVLADYGAAHNTKENLNNGLDFEPWPPWSYRPQQIKLQILSGQASRATLDGHVRRILRTLFAYGFFDRRSYRDDDRQINKRAHARAVQHIEESAITLLRNRGVLPLRRRRLKSIAVVGSPAAKFITGGGSGNVKPFSYATPLAAIRQAAGRHVKVTYDDGSDTSAAVAHARHASVAIVFAADYETEGADRKCLSLECPDSYGDQDSLIRSVAGANRKTVVVVETGAPVLTPWRNQLAGLVEAWYPGERGGPAIARVLFGHTDPGGRLPVTFPRAEHDTPTAGDPAKYPGLGENVYYKEGVLVGYRWYDTMHIRPAFPFGFGLSYTRFRYSGLRLRGHTLSFKVRNVGRRRGRTVAQLYVSIPRPRPGIVEPPWQLRGFRSLRLRPGHSARVRFRLNARSFSYWDVRRNRWAVPGGCFKVGIGRSSRDLPLQGIIDSGFGPPCARPERHG